MDHLFAAARGSEGGEDFRASHRLGSGVYQ
jgi:hypothetical protein